MKGTPGTDPEYAEDLEIRDYQRLERRFCRTENTEEFWAALYAAARTYCRRHPDPEAFTRVMVLIRWHLCNAGILRKAQH